MWYFAQLFGTLCPAITKHHSKIRNPASASTPAIADCENQTAAANKHNGKIRPDNNRASPEPCLERPMRN